MYKYFPSFCGFFHFFDNVLYNFFDNSIKRNKISRNKFSKWSAKYILWKLWNGDPAIPLLGISLKEPKTQLKECKHPYVHCGIIYNHQDMEAAWVSIRGWVDKTTMGHLHNGILLSHKKKKILPFAKGKGEHYAKWNKPVRGRQISYNFSHMWNLMNKLN